ncbi:MAG: DUF4157 domain-containing protein [Thermoanaerobaculia bacterium]
MRRLIGAGLVQPELRIGPINDRYEREADRMADRVMADEPKAQLGATPPAAAGAASLQRVCSHCQDELQREPLPAASPISELRIQRACPECEKELEEEDDLQRAASGSGSRSDSGTRGVIGARATPALESRVASLEGRGSRLSPAQRGFFEPSLGQDLGGVRLHTGTAASEAARLARARAFTVGRDIVFGAGQHRPETRSGQKLIAHELTHVVQQTPLTARRKPLLQRQAVPAEEPAAAPQTETAASETAPAETPAPVPEPEPDEQTTSRAPTPALLVEDDATDLGPGQMTKSAFMAATREAACRAADTAFAGTDNTTQGCPYIQLALRFYERRSARRIERDLLSYSPEAASATSARDYIPLISERVRQSAETFVETGEITGVPDGIPASLGRLAGGPSILAGLFFKAREGGPRGNPDPRAVQARLGSGQPLAGAVRSRMQSAFGRSFSGVRIHSDATASRLSDRFRARAFTVGNHVAFGSGEYRPGSPVGEALVAHELAHVVQQRDAGSPGSPVRSGAGTGALERDADRSAAAAIAGHLGAGKSARASPRQSTGLRLQRCGAGRRSSAGPSSPTMTCPDVSGLGATSPWPALVTGAVSSRKCGAKDDAKRLYGHAILKVATKTTPPKDVPPLAPKADDIQVNLSLSELGVTKQQEVPKNPDNYWRWIEWGPDSLIETEAHTEGLIFHELVHVRQFRQLWDAYEAIPEATRPSWEVFMQPYSRRERVLGPEELEAEITILDRLDRLTPREQRQGLEGVFIAYINTGTFTPAKGVTPPAITSAQARTRILAAFSSAADPVKSLMGQMLWRSLIRLHKPAAVWVTILRELEPVGRRGYADPTFQPHYDSFLSSIGLSITDVWTP